MCGICGIVYFDGRPVDRAMLASMNSTITHRGPDDEGTFLDPGVGLAMRRLSVIDVAGGHQPMSNEDESVWIVFNGEIFNFLELRADLEARHRFKTRSDTETILYLYEELGDECLPKLNGMFALAIWDRRKRRLLLARDRAGKKPLYYAEIPGGLAFGSELKCLAHLGRRIDRGALTRYLIAGYVPSPHAIFEGVKKLEPASKLIVEGGRVTRERFWSWERPTWIKSVDEAHATSQLAELLKRAVKRRLISDVPLGLFLSGGVDSSLVARFAADQSQKLKTFAIGFSDAGFDESAYAREVAQSIGTEHFEERFDLKTALGLVPEVFQWLDEPFADASLLPTYLLSRFTRKHVTVALSGDGGDEMFAGYPTYPADRVARRLAWIPGVRTAARVAAGLLPVTHKYFSFDFKARQFARGLVPDFVWRNHLWIAAFSPDEVRQLMIDPAIVDAAMPDIDREIRAPTCGRDYVDDVFHYYFHNFLTDDILFKVDRASMAVSLEVRSPLLDDEVMEFAHALPTPLKLQDWETKVILRRLLDGRVPEIVTTRRKQGFAIPHSQWLAHELQPLARDMLSESRVNSQGLFNSEVVTRLLDEHAARQADHGKKLWALLAFELWYDRWAGAES